MRVIATKTIEIESIGTVHLSKKSGIRRLSIILKPNRPIQVNLPIRCSFEEAIKYLYTKLDWIQKHLPRMKTLEKRKVNLIRFGEIETLGRTICIIKADESKIKVEKSEMAIEIRCPEEWMDESHENYRLIKTKVVNILKQEARPYLEKELLKLSDRLKLPFKTLKINTAQTRWGSCSFRNNINLNVQLYLLPAHLCEYIIIHELMHTKIKNHSQNFWNAIENELPEIHKYRKELKNHAILYI